MISPVPYIQMPISQLEKFSDERDFAIALLYLGAKLGKRQVGIS